MPLGISYMPPGPPPPAASCYICLEHSMDRKPLLRNCACRGDAGWAHVACLAEFAATKTAEALQQKQDSVSSVVSCWEICILCKTPHMQNMALAMAEAYVKQYENFPDTDELRFYSLMVLARSRFYVGDSDGALELCNRLRQTCDVLTSEGIEVRGQTAEVCSLMGAVFMEKQQFDDAILAFEQERDLLVAKYGPNSPMLQKNIEMRNALGIVECGNKQRDTAVELAKARKNFRENQKCVVSRDKLVNHSKLVNALSNDGRHHEAMEQMKQLVADSRQSLGPKHPETLRLENDAKFYRQKMLQSDTPMASNSSAAGLTSPAYEMMDVWAVMDHDQKAAISGQRVQVLGKPTNNANYICSITNDKGGSTKFKAALNHFILEKGTLVVVHGLVSSTDLNGKNGLICSFDKEKRRYAVSIEKTKKTVLIKPINLNIVFIRFLDGGSTVLG